MDGIQKVTQFRVMQREGMKTSIELNLLGSFVSMIGEELVIGGNQNIFNGFKDQGLGYKSDPFSNQNKKPD